MDTNNEQFDRLFNTVAKANSAMIGDFLKSNRFVDRDRMIDKGLYSDAVGLTGIMLTLVAFYGKDDGRVITPDLIKQYQQIVGTLVPEFYNTVTTDGYIFTPIIRASMSMSLFSAEERIGYTDTVTWIFSSAMLIRYACRKGILNLNDPSLDEKVRFLIFDCLKILLDSQREDGTWGFGTWAPGEDGQASKSLYFTYAVATTLADFFYYIRGEIDNADMEATNADAFTNIDQEMVDYLNRHLGCDDVIATVIQARERLQDWLIRNCLPLLPKLASCRGLTNQEKDALGMPFDSRNEDDPGELNFFNLYYTFYIIDMLISSEVDVRYAELGLENVIDSVYSGSPDDSAAAGILLSFRENPFFNANDRNSYLGLDSKNAYHAESQHIGRLLEDYLQQAVHTSRAMYMVSQRDQVFWDTSELPVEWKHDNEHIRKKIAAVYKGTPFTDPSFAPMALRANADYVFYITKKPDSVLNDLFSGICEETFIEERLRSQLKDKYNERGHVDCLPYLWDTQKYSLLVSERSLESLVDYFDYLGKYESGSAAGSKAAGIRQSALEIAIEQKILDCLRKHEADEARSITEKVDQMITERLGSITPATVESAPSDDRAEAVKSFLSSPEGRDVIIQVLRDCPALSRDLVAPGKAKDTSGTSVEAYFDGIAGNLGEVYCESTEPDKATEKMIAFYENLRSAWIRKQIRGYLEGHQPNLSGTRLNNEVYEVHERSVKQMAGLLSELSHYLYLYPGNEKPGASDPYLFVPKYTLREILEQVIKFANTEKFNT